MLRISLTMVLSVCVVAATFSRAAAVDAAAACADLLAAITCACVVMCVSRGTRNGRLNTTKGTQIALCRKSVKMRQCPWIEVRFTHVRGLSTNFPLRHNIKTVGEKYTCSGKFVESPRTFARLPRIETRTRARVCVCACVRVCVQCVHVIQEQQFTENLSGVSEKSANRSTAELTLLLLDTHL